MFNWRYPFTAKVGTCKFDANFAESKISGYKAVNPHSAQDLKAALVNSPIVVAVDASSQVFKNY